MIWTPHQVSHAVHIILDRYYLHGVHEMSLSHVVHFFCVPLMALDFFGKTYGCTHLCAFKFWILLVQTTSFPSLPHLLAKQKNKNCGNLAAGP